ncbi:hypothetical protein VP1G_10566 [Cytospora mali]|uniref:Uncharacterized protein n=1 Tax=Cytospora mali TaxID=578113 RepID=A0A194UPV6_CYTMA|nr:hypothetical protein VP1G_10566 [Valsa mali var. pyri (nom. inval.)]
MPAFALASNVVRSVSPTGLPQQQSASKNTADDESNVIGIVFGILATILALLSVVVAYQQLAMSRQR